METFVSEFKLEKVNYNQKLKVKQQGSSVLKKLYYFFNEKLILFWNKIKIGINKIG